MTDAEPDEAIHRLALSLRARRIELGLPLKTVAARMCVRLEWLCQLEHGAEPKLRTLKRWAHALGGNLAIDWSGATKEREHT